jgi:hypothetical protein
MRDAAVVTFDPFAAAPVKQKITVEVRTILLFLSISLSQRWLFVAGDQCAPAAEGGQ